VSDNVQWCDWHNGWLAFLRGRALRHVDRTVRVFPTQAHARAALEGAKADARRRLNKRR
jgi:hypothetical protein